jgi:hypothetical protein
VTSLIILHRSIKRRWQGSLLMAGKEGEGDHGATFSPMSQQRRIASAEVAIPFRDYSCSSVSAVGKQG